MKENYPPKEVKQFLALEHNYGAFIRWYENGNHTALDNSIRQSVLVNTIKDIERARKEMGKYPEFFDEDKRKRLSEIIEDLEEFAQTQPKCTETHNELCKGLAKSGYFGISTLLKKA